MRWIAIAVSSLFLGGAWTDNMFIPVTHPDGSQTWTIRLARRDIPKEDRALTAEQLAERYAGTYLAHHKFCQHGWKITSSRFDKKLLLVEGNCVQSRSS